MKIEIEQHPDIAVLVLTEGFIGDEADLLVSTVQQILEIGTVKFVVDLSQAGRVDSAGMGSLVAAYAAVVKQGGRLVVVLPEDFFKSLIHGNANFVQIFEVDESREEAIEALQRPNTAPDQTQAGARKGSSGCLVAACAVFLTGAAMVITDVFL